MSNIVKIDNKYYDFGTTNESFLLTAQELKTLGIKNWYFMLEVKYPHLNVQDIDPTDPNISAEDIGKLHIENKANLWFWLRECALIPVRGAPKPYKVCLTRASAAAGWCFQHSIDFILCQPRQTWKTTFSILLIEYSFIYVLKNATIPLMHLTEKKVIGNANMLKDYIEILPAYMNPFAGKKKIGIKSMTYDEHNTKISLLTSAENEVAAGDKLRGDTLFIANIDEWEYINFIDSVIMGGAPAVLSGRNISRENNGISCMMYTSTPGNLDTQTGKAAQRMIDATPVWTEQYYDLSEEDIQKSFEGVKIESEDGKSTSLTMLYIEYDYKQLRKTDAWLREQYEEAIRINKVDEYRRGVLLQRYRGSSNVLFRQEDIDYIVNNQKKPDYDIFIMKKYHLYVYKHEIKLADLTSPTPYFDISVPYLIGMDFAAGGGGDNTTVCVVHPYTLEIVAELSSPYLHSLDQMRVITQLAIMIPKGIFCIESNNIGKAVVSFMQESPPLLARVYHDPRLDISKNAVIMNPNKQLNLKRRAEEMRYIGTHVNESNRRDMFEILKRHVRNYRHLLLSRYIVKDIQNLVIKSNKIQADVGEHDDFVMAYLHAVYVLYYGHELTRFGIDKTLCTYEQAVDIIHEFDNTVADNIVDNTVPYDCPTIYEDRLLNDIIASNMNYDEGNMNSSFCNLDGTDQYGYRKDQYSTTNMQQSNDDTISQSDLAFFRSLNSF